MGSWALVRLDGALKIKIPLQTSLLEGMLGWRRVLRCTYLF